MNTIWKYELSPGQQVIKLPKGANILSVTAQEEVVCLWAFVTPENEPEMRVFRILGTGDLINNEFSELEFIGTVQLDTLDNIVSLHVFEVRR